MVVFVSSLLVCFPSTQEKGEGGGGGMRPNQESNKKQTEEETIRGNGGARSHPGAVAEHRLPNSPSEPSSCGAFTVCVLSIGKGSLSRCGPLHEVTTTATAKAQNERDSSLSLMGKNKIKRR